jgi:hypothetical protein
MEKKASCSKEIDKLCSAYSRYILKAFTKSQPLVWPIPMNESYWYISKYFLKEAYDVIEKLKNKGISEQEIARLFRAPTRIIMFISFIYGMNFSDMKIKEKVELIQDLLNYLSYYKKEDILSETGKNIIWTPEHVADELKKHEMIGLDTPEGEKLRKTLGRINAALWLHCERIHGAFHSYGYEFHGPYELGNGESLVVREYYDIKPTSVWPFTSTLPFNELTTYEIYKECYLSIDMFNHLEASSPLPQCLQRFSVFKDGDQNMNLTDLENILASLNIMLERAIEFTPDFTKEDWAKKIVEMHYWYIKPHKDLLSENWRPPNEVYSLIKEGLNVTEMNSNFKELEKLYGMSEHDAFNLIKNFLLKSIYGEANGK